VSNTITPKKPAAKNEKQITTRGGRTITTKNNAGSRYNEIYTVLNEALMETVNWEKLNIPGFCSPSIFSLFLLFN